MTISFIGESAYIPGQGRPASATPGTGPEATSAAPSDHALSGTARLLGLSADQLSTALKAGTTLGQLAFTTGVPASAVLRSVEHDLRVEAPGDGAALSDRRRRPAARAARAARTARGRGAAAGAL